MACSVWRSRMLMLDSLESKSNNVGLWQYEKTSCLLIHVTDLRSAWRMYEDWHLCSDFAWKSSNMRDYSCDANRNSAGQCVLLSPLWGHQGRYTTEWRPTGTTSNVSVHQNDKFFSSEMMSQSANQNQVISLCMAACESVCMETWEYFGMFFIDRFLLFHPLHHPVYLHIHHNLHFDAFHLMCLLLLHIEYFFSFLTLTLLSCGLILWVFTGRNALNLRPGSQGRRMSFSRRSVTHSVVFSPSAHKLWKRKKDDSEGKQSFRNV